MTIQEYLNDVITKNIAVGFVKKIYIIDKDGKRVDFSDWQKVNGTNRLIDYGVVETVIEKGFAHFYNKTGDIDVRNDDRFFDKPFPATLKDVYGNAATYLKDSNNIINIFKKPGSVSGSEINSRYTYIEIWVDVDVLGKIYPQRLATVVLSKIKTDTTDIATIKVDGLIEVLNDTMADTIKDASKNWYQNKPYTFLIKEVLKKAFGIYNTSSYSIELPSGFIIPRFLDFLVTFDSPVYSFFGRPPIQTDTNSDGEPDTYPDTNKICRAIVHDETNGCLYLGIDNELWKFDYTTWIFTLLDTLTSTNYIEYLQIVNVSSVDYLLIKCRVSNVHDIIASGTKYDSDLKSKTVSTYIKTLPSGSIRTITSSVVEYDTEFSYFSSLGYWMWILIAGNNVYPVSLSNWWGRIDKSSLDLQTIFNTSAVMVTYGTDIDFSTLNLAGITGSNEDGIHGATVGGIDMDPDTGGSNKLITPNIPIPFPQKVYLSSIGGVYSTSQSDLYSIFINRVKSFRDTPTNDVDSWGIFDSGTIQTFLQKDKNSIIELSDGYYNIIAETHAVKKADQYSVDKSATSPAQFFTSTNYYPRCRDLKFSLGQKGINGYHKTSDGYIYEIVINQETVRTALNYIENNLKTGASAPTNIQHSTKKTDVATMATLKIYKLNNLDSTTGRTEMVSVPKLYFEGREFQPTCTAVDSTNKMLYLFGMIFETVDSKVFLDAGGNERGRKINTTKYARCLVFETPLEGYGDYVATLNDDALNDKSNAAYYIPGTDKVHADGTNYSDLSNCFIKIKEVITTLKHTFYCTNQQISGAQTHFYYEEAGIIINKAGDVAAGEQNLLPVGNYRSVAGNGGALYKLLKRRDQELTFTSCPIDGLVDLAVLEAVHYPTNSKLYCSVLAINNIAENFVEPYFTIRQKYAICSIETGNFNNFSILHQFDYQPKHLQIKDGKLYFFLEGEGVMRSINLSNNALTNYDTANPPVKDELYSLANIDIRETTTPIFYGITSPHGKDRYNFKIPEGKYYLWQYNDEYVPIAELADFTDMNCEQVLAKLCEASNWIMGFDEAGNFFMVPRTATYSTPDLTLTEEYDTKIIDFKEKTDTSDELINSCTITPYRTTLENIENNITLKKRLEEKDYPNLTVNIEQRDLKAKTINLICVRGGQVSMDVEDITKAPLFKWKTTLAEIEVVVAVNSSNETIYLNSVFGGENSEGGVKPNDYIGFVSPTTGEYEFRKISTVTAAQNKITYDSTNGLFSFTLTKGLSGKIFKTDEVYYSDEYAALITEASTSTTYTFKVNSLYNIGVGNILRSTGTYKFAKVVNKYQNADGTYTIEVDKPGFANAVGETVKSYWSPILSNNIYEVGGSQVFVGVQAKDELDLTNANQRTFKIGDYIQVICKGLKLESDETSRQTYVDINSVGTYGLIKEKNAPDNKFLNRPLAKYLAKQVVTKNSKPRYQGTISSVYLPQLKFVNNSSRRLFVVRVQNSKLFPLLQNNSVDFYVTSIKHNLGKRQTEFSVKGIKGIGEA